MIWENIHLLNILLKETKILDYKIITGLLLSILFLSSSSLFVLNILKPIQNQSRVRIHCVLGMFTISFAFIHVWDKILFSSEKLVDLFGLGLILMVMSTGVVLLYFSNSGILRHYSRSFHPALVLGMYLFLLLHLFSLYG